MVDKRKKKSKSPLLLLLLLGGGAAAALALSSKRVSAAADTHKICDRFNNRCIVVPGRGINSCEADGDCPPIIECFGDLDCAPGDVCVNGFCQPVQPGCVKDVDCDGGICFNGVCQPFVPEAHRKCEGNLCILKIGAGVDECDDVTNLPCAQAGCNPACLAGEQCVGGVCQPIVGGCVDDGDCLDPNLGFCNNGICQICKNGDTISDINPCPDGSFNVTQRCNNGLWENTGNACPLPGVLDCQLVNVPAQVRQGDGVIVGFSISNNLGRQVSFIVEWSTNVGGFNNQIFNFVNIGQIFNGNLAVGNAPCCADIFVDMNVTEFDPNTGNRLGLLCSDRSGAITVFPRQQVCDPFVAPQRQLGFGILVGRARKIDGSPPPLDRFGQPDTQILSKNLNNFQVEHVWDTDECGDLIPVVMANNDLPISGSLWVFSRTGLYPETKVPDDRFNLGADEVNDISPKLILPI
ncbi:MAG: EB domain-containing protein [archaeon]|nr:EB domain-containing protein [archaeon]